MNWHSEQRTGYDSAEDVGRDYDGGTMMARFNECKNETCSKSGEGTIAMLLTTATTMKARSNIPKEGSADKL